MAQEVGIRLRLAMSSTLLTLWACGWIFDWPVVGTYNILFLAAIALQWPDRQYRRSSRAVSIVSWTISALVVIVFVLAAFALKTEEMGASLHSPFFVLPVWAAAFISIVLNSNGSAEAAADCARNAAR